MHLNGKNGKKGKKEWNEQIGRSSGSPFEKGQYRKRIEQREKNTSMPVPRNAKMQVKKKKENQVRKLWGGMREEFKLARDSFKNYNFLFFFEF